MDERPRKPVVVHRPEPPADEDPKKLSHEEVRALLAVTKTNRPDWARVAKRAGFGMIPTVIVGVVLDATMGWWGTPVLAVVWIAWAAWPLARQGRDGWT